MSQHTIEFHDDTKAFICVPGCQGTDGPHWAGEMPEERWLVERFDLSGLDPSHQRWLSRYAELLAEYHAMERPDDEMWNQIEELSPRASRAMILVDQTKGLLAEIDALRSLLAMQELHEAKDHLRWILGRALDPWVCDFEHPKWQAHTLARMIDDVVDVLAGGEPKECDHERFVEWQSSRRMERWRQSRDES